MTERLFQFIWQHQYFNKSELMTQQGELLSVIHPGHLNTHQGPDFLSAKIRVGETLLAGNIELHLRALDWNRHGHDKDKNYENVILHVVWEDDGFLLAGVSTLVLAARVSGLLLGKYEEWMKNRAFVPCGGRVAELSALSVLSWLERMGVERLERKRTQVMNLFMECRNSWDECLWRMVARNFGLPCNAPVFEELAVSLPLNQLRRHFHQPLMVEAMLLGQAGLLGEVARDDYTQKLKSEFEFYNAKYKFPKLHGRLQFLRMRPSSFPAIRLSQLAMLLCSGCLRFSLWKECVNIGALGEMLDVQSAVYWTDHSAPGRSSQPKPKKVGRQMAENIIINSLVPLMYSYGKMHDEQNTAEKAVEWLISLKAENNVLIRGWEDQGFRCRNAWESQSLIELKKQYCDERKCLDCGIGKQLLKSEKS
ncbi:MAG: DUF2851 family protein [Gemmatimonadaceae bacterium]|nr:DUF2851 family protein [Chitinophagaceae bacterium]